MDWIYGIKKINLKIRYMELELKNPWIECMKFELKNPWIECMKLELKNSWIECIQLEKKTQKLDIWNRKRINPENRCMDSEY
jgi:hypothetical protein